jgi:hypothetical protein
MISEEKSRKDFESWLRVHVRHRIGREPYLSRVNGGQYVNSDYERRWEAWKAALWEYGEA